MNLFQRQVRIESGYAPNVIPLRRGLGDATPAPAPNNTVSDVNTVLSTFLKGGQDFFESITGSKQQREAREQALVLQTVNAQRMAAETDARSAGWTQATPWLVAGGTAVIITMMLVLRKR